MDSLIKKFKLPKAEKFKQIITRFPPEPSGYLHIGHAKAAIINYYSAKAHNGYFILRFDDTNPSKEKQEFFQSIKDDLVTLGIVPDKITHTSDYFDELQALMRKFIEKGLAFADNTPHDEMKELRSKFLPSKNRDMPISETLKVFEALNRGEMKEWCIRAKIDYKSKNGCMRDPVFYRCVDDPHYRFGTKYKAYPIYDFATPIVDSLEEITHCMRTNEYADRHHLYKWLLTNMEMYVPDMHDFSRLNFKNTVLSKRKLNLLVNEKVVDGWDDPRFPTIRGVLRRGILKEGLIDYIQEQGHSKNSTLQEWDKLYSINKKYIDPVAPRFAAIMKETAMKVTVENFSDVPTSKLVALHPKNDVGTKECIFNKHILVESGDLQECQVGEKITLMKWGNAKIKNLNPCVVELDVKDKDFKGTKKINWVADLDALVEINVIEHDHLLTRADAIDYEGPFMDIVNKNTRFVSTALCEPAVRSLKQGDIIQIERRGFYIVDHCGSSNMNPSRLIYIPDGKSKNMSNLQSKVDVKQLMKGDEKTKKGDEKKKDKVSKEEKKQAKADKKENKKLNKPFKLPQTEEDYKNLDKRLESSIYLGGDSISKNDIELIQAFRSNQLNSQLLSQHANITGLLNILSLVNINKVKLVEDKKEETKKKDDQKQEKKDDKKKQTPSSDQTSNKSLADFSMVKLVVGKIIRAWKHETADKLLCEEIDIGTEKRMISSGLVGHYTAEEIVNKRVIVFANLKEKKLVGFPSHGMVMCASDANKTTVKILSPPEDAQLGDVVTVEGSGQPNHEVGAKKLLQAWDNVSKNLNTDKDGIANISGVPLKLRDNIIKNEVTNGIIS